MFSCSHENIKSVTRFQCLYFVDVDSIFRSNSALLFYWLYTHFMAQVLEPTKNPSVFRQQLSGIENICHYLIFFVQFVCIPKFHCKFSQVSMFEYNFNFVKTFLIWCFQDFTKGKFIQMNFIHLKLEFFNKWKWNPAWF